MTTAQILPTLIVPLIVWRVYRRVRRNIGRQPLRPGRLLFTTIFFSVIIGLIALSALRSPPSLAALGGGLLCAVPLGLVALRLTRFEVAADGKFYTPNTVIGLGVTLLFIGRLAYRMVTLRGAAPDAGSSPAMFQSPLTLFFFGVTAGFYVNYSLGIRLHRWEKA